MFFDPLNLKCIIQLRFSFFQYLLKGTAKLNTRSIFEIDVKRVIWLIWIRNIQIFKDRQRFLNHISKVCCFRAFFKVWNCKNFNATYVLPENRQIISLLVFSGLLAVTSSTSQDLKHSKKQLECRCCFLKAILPLENKARLLSWFLQFPCDSHAIENMKKRSWREIEAWKSEKMIVRSSSKSSLKSSNWFILQYTRLTN